MIGPKLEDPSDGVAAILVTEYKPHEVFVDSPGLPDICCFDRN